MVITVMLCHQTQFHIGCKMGMGAFPFGLVVILSEQVLCVRVNKINSVTNVWILLFRR